MENQEQRATVIGQITLVEAVEKLLADGRDQRKKEFLMEELVRAEKDIWSKQINMVYVQNEMPKLMSDLEDAVNRMTEVQDKINAMEANQSHKRNDRDAYKDLKKQLEASKKIVEQKEDRVSTVEQKIKAYEGKIEETRNYMAFLVENFK